MSEGLKHPEQLFDLTEVLVFVVRSQSCGSAGQ